MKIRLVVALVGLAIGFTAPTFAQQKETKETVDPKTLEQLDALGKKYDEAQNSNDAAAVAALYTEDAVWVTPQGTIVGREAIEKQYAEYFKFGRQSNHTTTPDPASYQIIGTTDTITFSGGWSVTVEVQGKPQEFKGRWLVIDTHGSDGWKIWRSAFNVTPAPAATPSPTTTPSSQ
jgi:uncharacterized protein (TIGR02246 family)